MAQVIKEKIQIGTIVKAKADCARYQPQLRMGGDGMPITTVTWLLLFSLIGTDILINLLDKKKIKTPDRRLAKDRRHFSYTYHIPERRSGHEVRKIDRRLEKDRRHFKYTNHIPDRRSGSDRRLSTNK
jgi:hypothetical protein